VLRFEVEKEVDYETLDDWKFNSLKGFDIGDQTEQKPHVAK
jgi:hypothetical protein